MDVGARVRCDYRAHARQLRHARERARKAPQRAGPFLGDACEDREQPPARRCIAPIEATGEVHEP